MPMRMEYWLRLEALEYITLEVLKWALVAQEAKKLSVM